MIGLGLGAGQTAITVIAFAFIVGILGVRHLVGRRATPYENLYVTVRHDQRRSGTR